jgi:cell cycle checkpoint protein
MILIFSDVYEGKYRPEDLERILDRNVLYSSAVKIMEINPVTKPSMKKCLNHIIQAEYPTHGNPRNLSRRGKGNTCKNTILDSTWIDEIHTCTGGDLRQAIMTLQFLYCAKQYEKKKSNDLKPLDHHHRDVTLSTFHALGKLLYAKRRDPSSNHLSMSDEKDHHRPPLDFNPEQVLEGSSIGLYGALTFLGYHSPDFFTDIMELSDAMDTFSDAAFFMDKVYTVRFGNRIMTMYIFRHLIYWYRIQGLGDPMSAYASSFASRAVACANKHAAPNKFRQFTSPKYFTVVRKREWNRVKMSQMLRRLSNSQGHLQVDVNISSSNQFFMECFSLVHSILPLGTCISFQ